MDKLTKMFKKSGLLARIFGYDSKSKIYAKVKKDLKLAEAIEDDIYGLSLEKKELRKNRVCEDDESQCL